MEKEEQRKLFEHYLRTEGLKLWCWDEDVPFILVMGSAHSLWDVWAGFQAGMRYGGRSCDGTLSCQGCEDCTPRRD